MKKSITIAGNIIVDIIKTIDIYPKKGMLANIVKTEKNVGGCVPNTAITLSKLGNVSVKVSGLIGNDEEGKFIINELSKNNIDYSNVIKSDEANTSFTDVMNQKDTGERTFFNSIGANALFKPEHISMNSLDCSLFHFGYILLLDSFDSYDKDYGTVLAKYLAFLQKNNIKTSIDVVSDSNIERYQKVVIPALKYCDYVIINEIEAGHITNINPRFNNNKLNFENIQKITNKIMDYGVKTVIIHAPEAGFAQNKKDNLITVSSLDLPKNYIVSSVGAGDAFCAGILYSIYNDFPLKKALEVASCVAASNLAGTTSTNNALSFLETMELEKKYERKKLD